VKQDFADGPAEPTNAIGREIKGEITDDLARSTNEFKQTGGISTDDLTRSTNELSSHDTQQLLY
jgi:hypothetical protein